MILPAFQYHQPQTLTEAIALANSCNGDFDFVSCGTDLLPILLAVANAIYDATGVRMRSLPMTADKIWRMMQQEKCASVARKVQPRAMV